jgi:hypothetical protein
MAVADGIGKRTKALGVTARIALAAISTFLSACAPDRPRPAEMDLTTAEIVATPLFERILDPDQLTLLASANPVHGVAPLEVRFNVRSLDNAWRPTYVWNFGDGSSLSWERYPTHVYRRPGVYRATVRVTDRQNKVGAEEVEIIVLEEER